jgi:hypothetical protein
VDSLDVRNNTRIHDALQQVGMLMP